MIVRLAEGVRLRTLIALSVLLVLFLAAPLAASDYLLTVLTLILYFAYTGQAWNIMMGFAGQLSLGHALYVGLGALHGSGAICAFRHRTMAWAARCRCRWRRAPAHSSASSPSVFVSLASISPS